MMRSIQLNADTLEQFSRAAIAQVPYLLDRDGGHLQNINRAAGLDALLDLMPNSLGIAEQRWFLRLREFGPGAAPVIAQWFRSHVSHHAGEDRALLQERSITGMRWCEAQGSEEILRCWDDFDDYGRSLACVALGLLGAQGANDRIWDFYQRVKHLHNNLFVGALWGLIDLGDSRAADALYDLLKDARDCYELFGFLSLAGDRRAVLPLLLLCIKGGQGLATEAMWAVTGIGHRIGRAALEAELQDYDTVPDDAGRARSGSIVESILSFSEADVEDYFGLFYGQSLDNAGRVADAPASLTASLER